MTSSRHFVNSGTTGPPLEVMPGQVSTRDFCCGQSWRKGSQDGFRRKLTNETGPRCNHRCVVEIQHYKASGDHLWWLRVETSFLDITKPNPPGGSKEESIPFFCRGQWSQNLIWFNLFPGSTKYSWWGPMIKHTIWVLCKKKPNFHRIHKSTHVNIVLAKVERKDTKRDSSFYFFPFSQNKEIITITIQD